VDLKEIRSLVDLMKKNGIAVFKLERENFKITLKTNEAGQPVMHHSYQEAPVPVHHAIPAATPKLPVSSDEFSDLEEIVSPMVGTFYASPSPDSPAFVEVGKKVTPDTVVCIIEAMKVMNEVKAEKAGTIAEICGENGKPVQFGQPLFRLK